MGWVEHLKSDLIILGFFVWIGYGSWLYRDMRSKAGNVHKRLGYGHFLNGFLVRFAIRSPIFILGIFGLAAIGEAITRLAP